MHISVLITTFNRAEYLRLCLLGYLRQSQGDFEIVISDDGSTDSTPKVVEEFRKSAPFPVTYIWRPHEGHRRAEVINRAILAARHEWLLFTDSDSIPSTDLVEVHRRESDLHRLLCGGCIRLDQDESASVNEQNVMSGDYEKFFTTAWKRRLRRKHWINLFHIAMHKPRRPHNLGLNMSCSRGAMMDINGYDQNFRGWGNADGDVRDRLRRIGVKPKSVIHQAIVYHLWHEEHPTRRQRLNRDYSRRSRIPARCEYGISSLPADIAADLNAEAPSVTGPREDSNQVYQDSER